MSSRRVQPVTRQPYKRQRNAPVRNTGYRMQREWSTGICGCCEDVKNCLAVTFCGLCYSCYLPTKANENPFLCFCLPQGAWLVALRTKVRAETGIQGSICNDCCCVNCCWPCVMCQLSREIDNIKGGM